MSGFVPLLKVTVIATVPTANKRQSDMFKSLVSRQVQGWSIYEPSSYGLPKTW